MEADVTKTSSKTHRQAKPARPGGAIAAGKGQGCADRGTKALQTRPAGPTEADIPRLLADNPIILHAEQVAGRTWAEILANCRLRPGDPDFFDSWVVTWTHGFIRPDPEQQDPSRPQPDGRSLRAVRFALLLHWCYLSDLHNHKDEERLRGKAYAAITAYQETTELQAKLDSERARRRAGGRATAEGRKQEAAKRRHEWATIWQALASHPARDRTGIIAQRTGDSARVIRKALRAAGLR